MSSNPIPDYTFWTFVLSAIAIVLSAFSVVAQYLGLFRPKLKVPTGGKVIVYQTNGDILGGIVTRVSRESVTLKRVYHLDEGWGVGTAEPMYMHGRHITDADFPVGSILRWKKFPDSLSKLWDTLPD